MYPVRQQHSWYTVYALSFCLLVLQVPHVPGQRNLGRNSSAVTSAFREVVAGPSESTVRIISDDQEVALGAIVSADGYIVTKASELRGKLMVRLKDGRKLAAKLIGVEEAHDLAMLKIEATGLKPVTWLSSKEAEVGTWVVATGPTSEPVAIGVISVPTRKPAPLEMPKTAPKTNSGYLGIVLEPNEENKPIIGRITPDSPAARAGLRPGDLVLSVGGRMVKTTDRLIATIQGLRPGQTVSIEVQRGEEEKEFSAKLDRFPLDLLSRGERMNMLGSELSYRLGGFPVILQHDLLIKPSDCGGPLVNLDGKTVGINIARAGRTESYAVPAETVQSLLEDLKLGKYAPEEEYEDKQVTLLRQMIREIRADLAKAQEKLNELGENASAETRRSVENNILELKRQLAKTQEELTKARNPRKPTRN